MLFFFNYLGTFEASQQRPTKAKEALPHPSLLLMSYKGYSFSLCPYPPLPPVPRPPTHLLTFHAKQKPVNTVVYPRSSGLGR